MFAFRAAGRSSLAIAAQSPSFLPEAEAFDMVPEGSIRFKHLWMERHPVRIVPLVPAALVAYSLCTCG